ncbi:bile acid:sodium symporter family protein [Oceanobacter mangrovi]|uniref:bile acid:sodium symporter family protein n=1 Tax=Oceanobacter mangrovi TaxID=2862510 RepID=UPI001FE4CCC2|nr:bile acid:sodium symporter family protein [Oceanobacter mangrovi]
MSDPKALTQKSLMSRLGRFLPDAMILKMLAALLLASLLPVQGAAVEWFDGLTNIAIALLFFMHGAKLSTRSVIEGLTHWRLHGLVFSITFVLFPLLAWLLRPLLEPLLGEPLYQGVLFLSALPATVQSAIAFTSMAGGNVPAAVCSAATSSLIGIFITPVLVLLLLGTAVAGIDPLQAVVDISVKLLLPFIAGQVARRWIGEWVGRNKNWLKQLDQGSILLVVYGAFSEATVEGVWGRLLAGQWLGLILVCLGVLALVMVLTTVASKALGFSREDRITILFAGSKKSLATGVPMAQVLFAGTSMGLLILPVMLFHQLQLMVCSVLAGRFARAGAAASAQAEVLEPAASVR